MTGSPFINAGRPRRGNYEAGDSFVSECGVSRGGAPILLFGGAGRAQDGARTRQGKKNVFWPRTLSAGTGGGGRAPTYHRVLSGRQPR